MSERLWITDFKYGRRDPIWFQKNRDQPDPCRISRFLHSIFHLVLLLFLCPDLAQHGAAHGPQAPTIGFLSRQARGPGTLSGQSMHVPPVPNCR